MKRALLPVVALIPIVALFALWLQPHPTEVVDEAKAAGKTAADFPQADEDYFKDMDGGIHLTTDEIKGRDTWMVWTAGNDAFWDYLSNHSFGALDLLKTISSHPSLPWKGRDERFHYLGLINEPGFAKATGPDPKRYGLWLDKRVGSPDPFENASKYPGVHGGSFYGWPTGVIGLRLFPNPAFDGEARKKWDPNRYYTDPSYYEDKRLVRPYRVGMSCAFCHASFDPLRPPADPENPRWRNLSSYIGAQYLRVGRIFSVEPQPKNFVWQLLQSPAQGSLDTSLLASDNINNPRVMNAIYNVGPRLAAAQRWGTERLAGGELENDQLPPIKDIVSFIPPSTVHTPHILKDGADSVGVLGAIERVYVSIGEFHEEWTRHFNLLVGGSQTPIEIATAKKNSVFSNATSSRATNIALFFLRAARPHHLKDAPGGAKYLTTNTNVLRRGKLVFADNCMSCHSSKLPPDSIPIGSAQATAWKRHEVLKPDFLVDNYLSSDRRYPITAIGTNACSSLASNAIRGHIWDNFSSETYKSLPSAGTIDVQNPIDETPYRWTLPAGGRGYVRVPSLVSIWASAPLLQNNSVGTFVNDPSVAGRMKSFDDSIQQLLWPQKRKLEMYRTSDVSYLIVPRGYLPDFLQSPLAEGLLNRWVPWLFKDDMVHIGPIPKGTPINLIANIDLEYPDRLELLRILLRVQGDLKTIDEEHLNEQQSSELLKRLVPDLLRVSKCPDFILNRGHMFGRTLSNVDKRALIEFLKTF